MLSVFTIICCLSLQIRKRQTLNLHYSETRQTSVELVALQCCPGHICIHTKRALSDQISVRPLCVFGVFVLLLTLELNSQTGPD